MEFSQPSPELDRPPRIATEVPNAELLLDPQAAAQAWPELAVQHPEFLQQIANRQELVETVANVFDHFLEPRTHIDAATRYGYVAKQRVAQMYDGLSSVLAEPEYARLVLYLPFELLPSPDWRPRHAPLEHAAQNFRENYLAAWMQLLSIQDMRATFVDGDILETHLQEDEPPYVIKAAHLAPKLVQAGLLSAEQVISLLEENDHDEWLVGGLRDSLMVIADWGLLSDDDREQMRWSDSLAARQLASELAASETEFAPTPTVPSLTDIQRELSELAAVAENGPQPDDRTTPRRAAWLHQKNLDDGINNLANDVSQLLLAGTLSHAEIEQLRRADQPQLADQVVVTAIQTATETIAETSVVEARAFYHSFADQLADLWQRDDPATQQRLATLLRRAYHRTVINDESLREHDVTTPPLTGQLSANLEYLEEHVANLHAIVQTIADDPELADAVYPLVTLGGSRLKGYSAPDSDIDNCVFIKPGTSPATKDRLRQRLAEVFAGYEAPLEFWLEADADGLHIQDLPLNDYHAADRYWTHILFGTAWVGDTATIDELRTQLVARYFVDPGREPQGFSERDLYLERLERDGLQYRLLHKGYDRHYPRYQRLTSRYAAALDGDSPFWDPGYRQLATKLFLEKVWLPKISS